MGGGRLQEVVAHGGSTVFIPVKKVVISMLNKTPIAIVCRK